MTFAGPRLEGRYGYGETQSDCVACFPGSSLLTVLAMALEQTETKDPERTWNLSMLYAREDLSFDDFAQDGNRKCFG